MSESDKQSMMTSLRDKLENINSEIAKSTEECDTIQTEFGVMQKNV